MAFFGNIICQCFYFPKNAVLVVAGGLNKIRNPKSEISNYLSVIEKKFAHWTNENKLLAQASIVHITPSISLVHLCSPVKGLGWFEERNISDPKNNHIINLFYPSILLLSCQSFLTKILFCRKMGGYAPVGTIC